jgi:hypothetical protein
MMAAIQVIEARLEAAGRGLVTLLRFVLDVTGRDVLSRLGPRGMAAVTLPLIALGQTLLPRWGFLGGASLPVLWCAAAYYALRFRLRISVEALALAAVLAWLASRSSFWSAGLVLFAVAVGCGVLRHWLYAEFWPAYACAAVVVALCVPAFSLLIGLPSPLSGVLEFLGTLVLAPVTGAVMFGLLEWVRGGIGIRLDFPPEDEEERYDPSYVYPPFVARGSGA